MKKFCAIALAALVLLAAGVGITEAARHKLFLLMGVIGGGGAASHAPALLQEGAAGGLLNETGGRMLIE